MRRLHLEDEVRQPPPNRVVRLFSLILDGGSLPALVVVGLAILLNLALLDDADSLHYTLSQPVGVNEFIVNSSIRIPTDQGWSEFIDLTEWFDVE